MSDCPCDTTPALRLDIAAGLDALPRQLRSFPDVRRALLAALPSMPALRDWRARNSRDLGLMLLDMWAYVADVLGFYDERIANESYIRTAQRRPSLRRLVQLLGYTPAPGIAGSIVLAAIADGRDDVILPVGTGFRSDAFAGQAPQVFEITRETVINPFKNEWTIGPVPGATLPQPTPTELTSGAGPESANAKTFLAFETAGFGLATGQIVTITADVGSAGVQTARVKTVKPFAGKDGKTYNEVTLDRPVEIPKDVLPEFVHAQKPTAGIKATLPSDDPDSPAPISNVDNVLTVCLERETSQLAPTDSVIIRDTTKGTTSGSESLMHATVEAVTTVAVTIPGSPILAPVATSDSTVDLTSVPIKRTVTQITLRTSTDFRPFALDPTQFTFHFNLVTAGNIATVGKTDLAKGDLEDPAGLPAIGIVQPPPGAKDDAFIQGNRNLQGAFLLSDPNKHGAAVTGNMRFDSTGRATLFVDSDTLNPAEQTFRTPLTVLGNLLSATRGETVNSEVLGSGDPRIAGQRFKLKKKPLTYLLANDIDRVSTLKVFVDGVAWHEMRSFLQCGSQSRVFTVSHDDDQETFITFGDGVHGARLPSGVGNVIATYRFGSGKAAPPAGAVQQIARPVIGLRSVRSPVAAREGRDPDGPDDLRVAGPQSALLFDRAVSARDFESVAMQLAGVVKVNARFDWIPAMMSAGVVVRYIGTPSEQELAAMLRKRSELNLVIDVHRAQAIDSTLSLVLELDPDFLPDPVIAAVRTALLDAKTGPLAPANAPIGGQFLAGPIYQLVQSIPGVVAIQNARLIDYPDNFDLALSGLVCVPTDFYFNFPTETGVSITQVRPTGAVSASRTEGC
jgi:hypothetical protein